MSNISVFTYNGERDVLKLHLGIMGGHVDRFIICEAKTTFTCRPKPLYFFRDQRVFKPWWSQIEFFVIDDDYTEEEVATANASPLTKGASHWKWEYLQKSRLAKALSHAKLQDDDTVYIGDVDEIPDPFYLPQKPIEKLKLRVYNYYLNNRSDEEFWGTLVGKYGYIKDQPLNELRNNKDFRNETESGWHFSSMGGLKEVQRKLNDTYTHETYNMNIVPGHVEACIAERRDLLNRPFTYKIGETDWPPYLQANKEKFKTLLWHE